MRDQKKNYKVEPRCTDGAKMDTKGAYWMVPVRPQDRSLLGVQWEGQLYVDAALPFGLRSAPKFSMHWQMVWNGLRRNMEWSVLSLVGQQILMNVSLTCKCFWMFTIIWGYQYHKRRWRGRPHTYFSGHTH